MKFRRIYTLMVEGMASIYTIGVFPGSPAETLGDLLTVDFDINRSTLAGANTGRFTIRNLAETTRRDVYHDRYDFLNHREVEFRAGYSEMKTLPLIFKGDIRTAYSSRQKTDWVTDLDCYDGIDGIVTSQFSDTIPASRAGLTAFLKGAIAGMNFVKPGAVSNFDTAADKRPPRGRTVAGNTWDILQQLTPGSLSFIDNGRVNLLKRGDYIANSPGISLITSESGLLGTPRRQNEKIELDMIFEPRLDIGQQVEVRSLEKVNNGFYQVCSIRHHGTISGAVDNGATTTVGLWLGSSRLSPVQ